MKQQRRPESGISCVSATDEPSRRCCRRRRPSTSLRSVGQHRGVAQLTCSDPHKPIRLRCRRRTLFLLLVSPRWRARRSRSPLSSVAQLSQTRMSRQEWSWRRRDERTQRRQQRHDCSLSCGRTSRSRSSAPRTATSASSHLNRSSARLRPFDQQQLCRRMCRLL